MSIAFRGPVVLLLACLAAAPVPAQPRSEADVELADRLLAAARDAAARHPGTQAAQWHAQAARHELVVTQRRRLPRPSVALTAQQGSFGTDARLTQTLYDWGGTQARIDAAEGRVSAAAQGVLENERNATLDVIEAWRAWATSGLRARAQTAGLRRLADCELGARRRADAGLGSVADLVLVQARLEQARSELVAAQAAQASASARLRGLGVASAPPSWPGVDAFVTSTVASGVGPLPAAAAATAEDAPCHASDDDIAPAAAGSRAVARIGVVTTKPGIARVDALVANAVERSAVLARLRAEAASADAMARVARADRFPVINAVALHQRTGGSFASGPAPRLLITLEYAPSSWDGGADTAQAAISRAAAARAQLDAARQTVALELEAEHALLTGLAERVPSEQAAVVSATAVLRSFARQFRSGRKGWLDVLNAARELTASEQGVHALQVDLVASWARLAVLAELRQAVQATSW